MTITLPFPPTVNHREAMTPDELLSMEHADNRHLAELVELATKRGGWSLSWFAHDKEYSVWLCGKPNWRDDVSRSRAPSGGRDK